MKQIKSLNTAGGVHVIARTLSLRPVWMFYDKNQTLFLAHRLFGSTSISLSLPTGAHSKSSLLQPLITIRVSQGFTMEQ